MKKVFVVSYCTWKSLGSILQSLALKQALVEIGYESWILLPEDKTFPKQKITTVKQFCAYLYRCLHRKELRVTYKKRTSFIDERMDVIRYEDIVDLKNKVPSFSGKNDIFLAGSDQIWNPDQCNPVFFLDFLTSNRRVSYAASMGNTRIGTDKIAVFKRLLNNFDFISVRESQCADAIVGLTEKNVAVHIDPTFLISADDWRKMETEYPIQEPYILLYMLYWDDVCKRRIQELKRKTGLKVVAIIGQLSRAYADRYLLDVGPGEFLWLIDHAEYVITSSFHGVAFSTIFKKQFSAVINPRLPSRIDNLMNVLQIPRIAIDQLSQAAPFPYDLIDRNIDKEQKRSFRYLEEILE